MCFKRMKSMVFSFYIKQTFFSKEKCLPEVTELTAMTKAQGGRVLSQVD